MAAGVVLDTSFLITLADSSRPNHADARRYWRHFIEHQIPIFLPTIVVSEFTIVQSISPEILQNCIVLPFNWDDAISAAKLRKPRQRRIALTHTGEARRALVSPTLDQT